MNGTGNDVPNEWEERYRSGDMPWDKGEPSPGLVEFLSGGARMGGRVLVPGCGLGHDVRAIATAANQVVGLDLAPSAVKRADAFQKTGNERYVVGDLFNLPPDLRGVFDWVWEHTCFCAIPPGRRKEYVAGVREALRTGGRFLAVFYMDPDHDGDEPPFGVTVGELDELFLPVFDLERDWFPSGNYPTRVGRERMRLMRAR